ncbi:Y-family DNA polymerase, partial [Paracoccus sanguinis]
MTGRRIVSIFLPSLAMERWQRAHPDWPADLPVALSAPGPKGQVIHDANRAAAQGGVRRGALVTASTALCPGLRIDEARPAEDAAALARLVHWARRWGPLSAPDGAAGMVIDTTGVAHLFGGEAAMLADIQGRFASAGLTARVAVAPGWGAAWALARFGPERAICHDLADLDPLPVEALRLSAETCLLLGRLGLKTVAALAAIPRLSLMRRFNRAPREDNPLIRLDQLRGALAEPVGAPEPPPLFQAVARLAEPVMDPRDWLPGLTAEVCAAMAARDQGCRRLRLSVFRVDGERRDVVARCAAPSREAAHLLRLWGDRLDRLDPGYGFDLITLTALATEPLEPAQPRLDAEGPDYALELARLVDRLTARFGPGPISCPVARESHIPERAEGPGGVLEVGG